MQAAINGKCTRRGRQPPRTGAGSCCQASRACASPGNQIVAERAAGSRARLAADERAWRRRRPAAGPTRASTARSLPPPRRTPARTLRPRRRRQAAAAAARTPRPVTRAPGAAGMQTQACGCTAGQAGVTGLYYCARWRRQELILTLGSPMSLAGAWHSGDDSWTRKSPTRMMRGAHVDACKAFKVDFRAKAALPHASAG